MANKTVLNYSEATEFAVDDFILMDSLTGGATKYNANNLEVISSPPSTLLLHFEEDFDGSGHSTDSKGAELWEHES